MPETTIVEFAEHIAGRKLTDFEKQTLETLYESQKRGDRLLIIPARYNGRAFMLSMVRLYNSISSVKEETK